MVSKAVLFASPDARTPVANKPLLLHALDGLVEANVRQVAVMAPPTMVGEVQRLIEAEERPAEVQSQVIDENGAFLDTLRQVAAFVGVDPFVVHLGDSLTHMGLSQALQGPRVSGNDALALIQKGDSRVRPLGAGLAHLRAAGIYIFGPGVLDLLPYGVAHVDRDREIAQAAERLEEAGGRIQLRPVGRWWRYRPRPDAMLQANRFVLSALGPGPADAELDDTDLQGPVALHPTARLSSTVVRGPVIVGPGVEISDAYVGPYTSIGAGVVIENAEVENSIILPEATIRHLGGRLEASIVGRRARVCRDFRLPRALRLTVGDGAEIALT